MYFGSYALSCFSPLGMERLTQDEQYDSNMSVSKNSNEYKIAQGPPNTWRGFHGYLREIKIAKVKMV